MNNRTGAATSAGVLAGLATLALSMLSAISLTALGVVGADHLTSTTRNGLAPGSLAAPPALVLPAAPATTAVPAAPAAPAVTRSAPDHAAATRATPSPAPRASKGPATAHRATDQAASPVRSSTSRALETDVEAVHVLSVPRERPTTPPEAARPFEPRPSSSVQPMPDERRAGRPEASSTRAPSRMSEVIAAAEVRPAKKRRIDRGPAGGEPRASWRHVLKTAPPDRADQADQARAAG